MVRTIYLLSCSNLEQRNKLARQTINGEKWKVKTSNGKLHILTDKEMVDISNQLQGWTNSVYRFGCAFIHLSNFHNYSSKNPFDSLSDSEKIDILNHMRYYHGGPITDNPSFEELAKYFPRVFDKIASNLECYLKDLEENKFIEI